MSMDHHNAMHQSLKEFMVKIGVMAKGDVFDHSMLKTKVIFMTSQLVYTVCTFLPIPWLYNNQTCHLYYVSSCCVKCLYFQFDGWRVILGVTWIFGWVDWNR